jgi:hypothetical protein
VAIFDIFSKRQKVIRGEVSDVYSYSEMPDALRVQIVHIWQDVLGNADQYYDGQVSGAYKFIVETLCREYGLFNLSDANAYRDRNYLSELVKFILEERDVEKVLDAVELSFRIVDKCTRNWDYLRRGDASIIADSAIQELNGRFREHGIGYQFVEGDIIRVDSELIHSEVVKPALQLLQKKEFKGAQQEFLNAYEHYRHGKAKEALADCLKSFESVMKAICDKRKWKYDPNSTAKPLIQICLDNNLIPSFWQQQYTSLRCLLESSVPTGRNKLGGHGQGTTPVTVPDFLVSYMLHMTASTIVFLIEAENNMP